MNKNARPQQQMLERSLGVLVQEGDMVESPLVKVIVFLAGSVSVFEPTLPCKRTGVPKKMLHSRHCFVI